MIRIATRVFFLLLFCCCGKFVFAQNKQIDSLILVLKTAKDTSKVNTLNVLSTQLGRNANYSESKKYADDALLLAEKLNFKKGIADSYNNTGNVYQRQGNYSEALKKLFGLSKNQ